MFSHILVPTDFGEPSTRALDLAIGLADRSAAMLTLLHVFEPTFPIPHGEGIVMPVDQQENQTRDALDRLLARVRARLAACDAVLRGPGVPSDEILEAARHCAADLIVMGTHGRQGFSRVMLGSVTEQVMRSSPIPLLTVSARGRVSEAVESTPAPTA